MSRPFIYVEGFYSLRFSSATHPWNTFTVTEKRRKERKKKDYGKQKGEREEWNVKKLSSRIYFQRITSRCWNILFQTDTEETPSKAIKSKQQDRGKPLKAVHFLHSGERKSGILLTHVTALWRAKVGGTERPRYNYSIVFFFLNSGENFNWWLI